MRESRRGLVIHPGALGDVLLAAPALRHLGALGYRTTLAVAPRLGPLFAASGLVEDARDIDGLGLHRVFGAPAATDALAPFAGHHAVVSWLGAGDAAYRAALGRLGVAVVVARSAPPAGVRRHASRHLLDTLAPLGPVPASPPEGVLRVRAAERAAAAAWLEARGVAPGEAVVLQPGAGSPAKAWPGFLALARRLRGAGFPVLALAGPADAAAIAPLLRDGALGAEALARDWPLARVAALLTLAGALVGNDSGPTHLAAAVGCPTVAVFGPSDPVVWAPAGPHVRVVAGAPDGPPWAGVGVDGVAAALEAVLSRRGAAAVGAAASGAGGDGGA